MTIKKDRPARLKALSGLSLRQSPDPASPLYEQWYEWKVGDKFEPPPHLNIELGLASGKFEVIDG